MNRSALCIRMLILLQSRHKMSTRQLAEALGTNPRNIREFRKELQAAGYRVEEVRGRNGGYCLAEGSLLPSNRLTSEELDALVQVRQFLAASPAFKAQDLAVFGLDKVLSAHSSPEVQENVVYLDANDEVFSKKARQMLELVDTAISQNRSIEMVYQSTTATAPEERKVDPYVAFMVRNKWYFVGFDHLRNEFRVFKFSDKRMKEVRITLDGFERREDFRLEDYIGSDSAFKGEVAMYEVLVKPEMERLFLEKRWGTSLKRGEQQGDWISYTFVTDNERQVFRNLFSFENNVLLKSPEHSRQRFLHLLKNLYDGSSSLDQ